MIRVAVVKLTQGSRRTEVIWLSHNCGQRKYMTREVVVDCLKARRCSAKYGNVQGKEKGFKGNKGKLVQIKEKVVENEGEGMCTLEVVCALSSELEDFHKSTIEETVWNPVLKYKMFVLGSHLVWNLVGSWILETKAFKIGRREVPFSVYDVALLMGLPATGENVTFEWGYTSMSVQICILMLMTRQPGGVELVLLCDKNVLCLMHVAMLIFPFLEVQELKRREPTMKAFNETDYFQAYVEDAQGIISIEDRL
ncbi:LOW QUALITY PROTEIN: hypothetical protein Cgig2_000815 [Carnegiea gigantea]|uniref:Uncharacterized protein n=1 Tax=Carnegiea gigantea TaxID=171969 RepID=A0A9Q1KHM3_9CARY|nr:LOW QUALITY PROTEIN: hypothetical protein Cgig2_000815 [Carnegiea gigantea]